MNRRPLRSASSLGTLTEDRCTRTCASQGVPAHWAHSLSEDRCTWKGSLEGVPAQRSYFCHSSLTGTHGKLPQKECQPCGHTPAISHLQAHRHRLLLSAVCVCGSATQQPYKIRCTIVYMCYTRSVNSELHWQFLAPHKLSCSCLCRAYLYLSGLPVHYVLPHSCSDELTSEYLVCFLFNNVSLRYVQLT